MSLGVKAWTPSPSPARLIEDGPIAPVSCPQVVRCGRPFETMNHERVIAGLGAPVAEAVS